MHPVIKCFDTQRGWCPRCKRRVRSRHPEQTSDANGAAGSQVGSNALALAADLKHRLAVSFRKIADLLDAHWRLRVTPGALPQASHRLADRGQPLNGRLQEEARASPSVHVDETGWRNRRQGFVALDVRHTQLHPLPDRAQQRTRCSRAGPGG